jgi:hypothetical protein
MGFSSEGSPANIGSLSVGDAHASRRFNSQETVDAASEHLQDRDRLEISVPAPVQPQNISDTPIPPSETSTQESDFSSDSSSHFGYSDLLYYHLIRKRSEEEELALFYPRITRFSGGEAVPNSTQRTPYYPVDVPGSPNVTQNFQIRAFDVDSMGGRASSLSLINSQGETVWSRDLPEGDSEYSVDLAPGQYTLEAQAGSRPNNASGNPDQLDNFRVEVHSSSPSGDSGSTSE